jgi:hypothetical protein
MHMHIAHAHMHIHGSKVAELASDLALTNLTETVGFSAKRSARQLWGGARASIAFCYRGLRITLGDVIESVGAARPRPAPPHPPPPLHPLHTPPQTPPSPPNLHPSPLLPPLPCKPPPPPQTLTLSPTPDRIPTPALAPCSHLMLSPQAVRLAWSAASGEQPHVAGFGAHPADSG